jgi:hypothetical protein
MRNTSMTTILKIYKKIIKSHWGTLVPRINVENASIQQIRFYVFLYIHAVVRHVNLVVWVHYYKRPIENNEESK